VLRFWFRETLGARSRNVKAHNAFILRLARASTVGGQRPLGRTVLALGFVLLPLAGVLCVASDGPDRAEYVYRGGSTIDRVERASCDATGILLPKRAGGELNLLAGGGTLHLRQTWLNRTLIAGHPVDEPANMAERPIDFGAGHALVAWGLDGTVTAYATRPENGLVSQWPSGRLDVAPLENSPDAPYPFWRATPEGVRQADADFAGPSRVVASTSETRVLGNASFLIHQAAIELPDGGRYQLPAWRTETKISNGSIDRISILYEDAFLEVNGASWTVSPGKGASVCRALEARVAGAGTTAADATGSGLVDGTLHSFDNVVVAYHGSFQLTERTPAPTATGETGVVSATTVGRFDAWGLDFAPVSPDRPGTAWVLAATGGGLVAALLARLAWGPIVGAFYARFGRDRVLDHPLRRNLWELVQSSPALPLSALAERLGIREKLAAYHLRVLERTNLVRTLRGRRRGRPWRLVVPGGMPPVEAKKLLLAFHEENDPKLRSIRRLLGASGMPRTALTTALVQEFSLTDRGARKVLQRAVELGLATREEAAQGTGEWIRCA
jgi:helix-turn-helix protein